MQRTGGPEDSNSLANGKTHQKLADISIALTLQQMYPKDHGTIWSTLVLSYLWLNSGGSQPRVGNGVVQKHQPRTLHSIYGGAADLELQHRMFGGEHGASRAMEGSSGLELELQSQFLKLE